MPTFKGVRRDEFIRSVRPDPKNTEALVLLQGYIGDSDLQGQVRVYSDPGLSDFIDLPEQDILYADPIPATEDPLGGSRLWVKKTTVFTTGEPGHFNRAKSSFLEGDILQAFGHSDNIPAAVQTLVREKISVPVINCNIGPSRNICPISLKLPGCHASIYQPSCLRTCGFVCTARPGCFIYTEICPPSVKLLCPSHIKVCQSIPLCPTLPCPSYPECPSWGPCPSIACQTDTKTIVINPQDLGQNPVFQPHGYQGGFNPYQNAGYGY